jgi:hypothetical protein
MVVDFEPPLICAPPSDCSPSLDPLEEPSPLPVGDPRRRPPMELYVIHHSEEIVVMEAALDLALVTMMGSHRQPVSTSAIKLWLQEQFNIPCADVVVRHYQSEDFLICFTYYDDIVRVLHAHPLANMPPPFVLVFKQWRRQLCASVESFVLLGHHYAQQHPGACATYLHDAAGPRVGLFPVAPLVGHRR